MITLKPKSNFLYFIFLLGATFFVSSCSESDPPKAKELAFNSEQWKVGGEKTRGLMHKDLIERKVLIGKSIDEVKELLGPANEMGKNQFIYFLETEFMGSWRMFMNIEFGDNSGMVISVWVTD